MILIKKIVESGENQCVKYMQFKEFWDDDKHIKLWIPKKSRIVTSDQMSKDVFTPTINIDSRVDAWKKYIGLNCIIHTKHQR